MGRPKINRACKECGDEHYAKGFCKPHYMAANRAKFNPSANPRLVLPEAFDYDDFWEFVKKELNIEDGNNNWLNPRVKSNHSSTKNA